MKKEYEATFHETRSTYGVELDIDVPGNPHPVLVAQDVFGEIEEQMQLLVYPAGVDQETESAVSIRFNDDGSIAEVVVPDGAIVLKWEDTTVSDWLKRRDGQ
ncbi:hypothetical protein PDESU_02228 [Pontiella desulfatans]|uniref:Uncharacterized protein n=1 Tax=Pontiella desulfatans TaxID=2750659 RepID=A0A6C2U264_PONDE|nr:50S ribosomal protein L31 [Pontiella desulfatans]VGO13671.1 hypothetical protein PDESU_02228 [Pontiella desulfatans]